MTDSDEADWAKDDGRQLRKDINSITALTLGKGSSRGIVPSDIEKKDSMAERFGITFNGHRSLVVRALRLNSSGTARGSEGFGKADT